MPDPPDPPDAPTDDQVDDAVEPDVLDELAAAAPVAGRATITTAAITDEAVDAATDAAAAGPDLLDELAAAAPHERAPVGPTAAAPRADADDEDLVAIADAAASRFADDVAAQSAAAAARRRRPVPAITDVPRRRLRSEDVAPERGAVLQYPSAIFPSPPVFRVRIPDGWLAMPLPEAEMAVRRPDAIDGFVANVIVRVRRIAAAAIDDDVRAVLGIDAEPDGMEVVSDDQATDVATPVRRLAIRFPGPGGETLLARHLLVYVPATEHVASVVWLAATWPESAGPAVAAEMEAIVASLRLFRPG